jgi:cytochrome c oxidase subunit I+III
MVALTLVLAGWASTIAARETNRRDRIGLSRAALALSAVLTTAGGIAGLAGPHVHGMDPTLHVYPAMVWVLVVWIAVHTTVGTVMLLYTLARSMRGRMTAVHDGDVRNVAVYAHFLAFSALVTFVVLAFVPELS